MVDVDWGNIDRTMAAFARIDQERESARASRVERYALDALAATDTSPLVALEWMRDTVDSVRNEFDRRTVRDARHLLDELAEALSMAIAEAEK